MKSIKYNLCGENIKVMPFVCNLNNRVRISSSGNSYIFSVYLPDHIDVDS